ncbi:MAG: hypothetical protein ACE5E1_06790 [Phycisphaerae bacterium]
MSHAEIISAARRSDQAWCAQVSRAEPLACGVAYGADAFPSFAEGHQLRDAWLADEAPEAVFRQVESHYAARGLTCGLWVPASGQAPAPVESLLIGKGWRPERRVVLGLEVPSDAAEAPDSSVRVLPARAMPKAYRASLLRETGGGEDGVRVGLERLDDPNYDVFLAMVGGAPAGRLGYLEVGDVARLTDFSVASAGADRDVSLALIAHFLRMVRRLLPRTVVACTGSEETETLAFLESVGFFQVGALPQFRRPPAPER